MNFAVVTFPGSNCDHDVFYVTKEIMGQPTDMIWHRDSKDLSVYDCVILPGGFSYGDYLRSGAIARFSPIMESVITFARQGGLVLGICNGFQILLEAGLLPGAMKLNHDLRFVCRYTRLRVDNNQTPFTNRCHPGQILEIPVAHGEGNYYLDEAGLSELHEQGQIVLRYQDQEENPNGSADNIAGICNLERNVFGLMPHPERCTEILPGQANNDGRLIFASIIEDIKEKSNKGGRHYAGKTLGE